MHPILTTLLQSGVIVFTAVMIAVTVRGVLK